jgi:ATP-dependent exoDNAse (exonuclease V) beta subunit
MMEDKKKQNQDEEKERQENKELEKLAAETALMNVLYVAMTT